VPHPVLIFDGIEDMVYGEFERGEVDFLSIGLGRVPCGLDYYSDILILILFRGNRLCSNSPFHSLIWESNCTLRVESSICIYF